MLVVVISILHDMFDVHSSDIYWACAIKEEFFIWQVKYFVWDGEKPA
jgi:hypothetical protein